MLAFQPGCHEPVVNTTTSCVAGVIGDIGNMQVSSIVVVAIVDLLFVGFLLVAAFQHSAAKHFNFVGQGTESPVCPLAYGMKVCVRAYGTGVTHIRPQPTARPHFNF